MKLVSKTGHWPGQTTSPLHLSKYLKAGENMMEQQQLSLTQQQRQADEGGNTVTQCPSWWLTVPVRLRSASGEQSRAARTWPGHKTLGRGSRPARSSPLDRGSTSCSQPTRDLLPGRSKHTKGTAFSADDRVELLCRGCRSNTKKYK